MIDYCLRPCPQAGLENRTSGAPDIEFADRSLYLPYS